MAGRVRRPPAAMSLVPKGVGVGAAGGARGAAAAPRGPCRRGCSPSPDFFGTGSRARRGPRHSYGHRNLSKMHIRRYRHACAGRARQCRRRHVAAGGFIRRRAAAHSRFIALFLTSVKAAPQLDPICSRSASLPRGAARRWRAAATSRLAPPPAAAAQARLPIVVGGRPLLLRKRCVPPRNIQVHLSPAAGRNSRAHPLVSGRANGGGGVLVAGISSLCR